MRSRALQIFFQEIHLYGWTLLICIKKGFNIEFSAASIIIVNIIGYLLGNATATLFTIIFDSPQVIHALATALTTEFLGWSIIAFTKVLQPASNERKEISTQYIKWIILAMTGVFGIRLGIGIRQPVRQERPVYGIAERHQRFPVSRGPLMKVNGHIQFSPN